MSAGKDRYAIPLGERRIEQSIHKSRFIATVGRATSAEEAQGFVSRISHEFSDATHNCWAYLIGPPGCTDRVGMSDDGEPHGTAGRPMLNALVHSGVGDVAVVVTRYYGGTKLGTGGLVRAYSGAVQAAIEELPLTERVEYSEVLIVVDYGLVTSLKQIEQSHQAQVLEEEYAESVSHRVRMPTPDLDAFLVAVGDSTRGRAQVQVLQTNISLM